MGHSYQFTAKIEGGEISDLYRAQQDGARDVALKLFSPKASDPAYGKALIDGSRRIGALNHPSILYFEEVGFVRERLCCARAGIDGFHLGTALSRLATKEVVLPPAVAVQIMIEALLAVGAAHAANLFHGAITPANILLARDGRVFVTDFLALWAMQRSPALKALASRGRQAYRAPEVAKGTEPDAGSDIYSAGAVLYELLTLREVASTRGGGVSTRRDVLTPPSRLDRRVNARLDPLVVRSLEALKSRRYKNGSEMAESLRTFQGATGAAVGREEVARFVRELFPNEMGMAAGETPWKGPFTLEAIDLNRTIPGLRIDAQDRAPYSQAAPVEPMPSSSEATVKVSAYADPADSQSGAPGSAAQEATSLDIDPGALAPAKAPEPPSFESWEAPPGVLDAAVARARQQLSPTVAPAAQVAPVVEAAAPLQPSPDTDPVGASATPVDAQPAPLPPTPRPPPRAKPRPANRVAAPAVVDAPQPVTPQPKPDWHVVIPPPPPPPRVRTPLTWWLAAIAMAAAAGGLAYLGLQHRLSQTGSRRSAAHVSKRGPRESNALPESDE